MTVSHYDMAFFSKSIIITVLRSGIIVRIVRIMLLLVLQKLRPVQKQLNYTANTILPPRNESTDSMLTVGKYYISFKKSYE